MGGFFKGQSYRSDTDPETVERACAMVWGEIAKDPTFQVYAKPKASFLVAFHSKQTPIRCEAWGDNPCVEIMRKCRKGEKVLCLGNYKKAEYAKKKKDPVTHLLECEIVIPAEMALAFLGGGHDAPPDAMESFG